MSGFVDVGAVEELPPGSSRCVQIDQRRVALFHTDEGIFATDDRCPHRGGPLSEGDLVGNEIFCPWHFWPFDVRTGKHPMLPLTVVTHEVKLEQGRILVRLASEPENVPEYL